MAEQQKQEDYGEMPDLRDQVPDLIPFLQPGEKVIIVEQQPTPKPEKLMDYHDALCMLTGVKDPKDIGLKGPASAAKALQGQENAAGQGLFDCWFGRDGLYAAEDLLDEFPQLTRTTLLSYASLIGMMENTHREEEFGRMFHESRSDSDPIAQRLTKKNGWKWPFYATVDATPLFVRVLAKYCLSSPDRMAFLNETYVGRDGKEHTIFDALRFSMQWIVRKMASNPEGYLEYRPSFEGSLVNQIMEDSFDSHFHANGTLANSSQGIASTEVQGLAYDALIYAATLYKTHAPKDTFLRQEASYFKALAKRLKHQVLSQLWVEEGDAGYFAVGTDRDEEGNARVMKIKKAIPAFLLDSLMLQKTDKKKVNLFIKTLFSKEMLAEGGIRSLGTNQPRFIPGGYHTGNVWLFQSYKIALGLRRLGYNTLAQDLEDRVIRAVEATKMYPEYVRGNTGKEIRINERVVRTWYAPDGRTNGREKPPQQIQLWTVSAYAAIQFKRSLQLEGMPLPSIPEQMVSFAI